MIQTRKSNPNKPVRIMAYGVEGVGKSTLGAKSDRPVFISPEGGTDQLTSSDGQAIDEMPNITNWDSLRGAIKALLNEEHEFKTVVLDSADWIEGLAHNHIIGKSGKTIITVNSGYGAGYRQSQNMHQELISDLTLLREKRGMNVILTAHATVKTVKDPEAAHDYDAFEIKCHEYVSSLWREWVDGLFFIRFRTFVKSSDDTVKARALTDGTRVLYTVKQPAFQAKNRYRMPPEMDFTEQFWPEFMKYAKAGVVAESAEDIISEIQDLTSLVTDDATKDAIVETVRTANGNVARLNQIRNRVKSITNKEGS